MGKEIKMKMKTLMKNETMKRFVAAILVAAISVTVIPQFRNTVIPTEVAEAKTKLPFKKIKLGTGRGMVDFRGYEITIKKDGNFTLEFSRSWPGYFVDYVDSHKTSTKLVDESKQYGRFYDIKKVGKKKYTMKIKNIKGRYHTTYYDAKIGGYKHSWHKIRGKGYACEEKYVYKQGEKFILYCPGYPVDQLPYGLINSMKFWFSDPGDKEKLDCYVLYNPSIVGNDADFLSSNFGE